MNVPPAATVEFLDQHFDIHVTSSVSLTHEQVQQAFALITLHGCSAHLSGFDKMATARITKAKSLLSTATARLESQLVRENASFVCDEGAGHNNEAGLPSGGDDRAGHEMGLALFGTSSSYLEEIDKEYEERLDSIEGEIDAIRAGLDGLGDCPTSGGDDAIDWQGVSIETMKRHVELLQICHQCKLDLEQIDTLSLSASHGGGVLNFSPSSMLFSPSTQSSDRFHFEKGNDDKSTVVHAARLVRKIDDSLNSAVQILNESGKENADANTYQDNPQLNQMHAIVNELKHQVRRKKMELRHRAISSLEGCITIDASKLSVRGTTVNSDKVGFAEATTPREGQKESCPLSDAYDVLEAFNNPQFPTFGETLERAIKTIGGRLVGLFEASMKELDANDVVGYYTFKQETFKSAPARSKYDVSIKGQGIQLVWELRKMDFVSTFGKATTIVSVASEMSGELLASSAPLASVATFLSCLNFLTQVMGFVHQHVLLQRRDLAVSLGKYLFGTYPIRTSLSSGSAVLGGILVGCAAQGEERGEVRPLMVKLLSLMRKWCIPSKSGEGVWNMIPEIQRVLMEEVGAFEGRMVELGFMGEEIQSAFGTASPSGLSVLVNSDEVASPIHTDSSFKRSLIEISSPPTEHNNTNTAVRSSLSEIADLFPQAYSESQRSQILNQGRNILVNTDYHNSVQVGKFVPPPAEPGTPEHLDEDPLAAFFFQRCSISTTAQKTLELVRQTLDQATQPSMAKELDALPPMLYRASRELLDLFRAMIPTLYASEISSIPRMAAILHNDCVYLAHEASLLGELLMRLTRFYYCKFCIYCC